MSKWPDYPDNRLIVNGVDLSENFRLILIDGYVLSPPEPKFHTVDIPGGNGVINLTEALSGDVVYGTRSQDFTFKLIYPNDFETIKTKLSNFLHGREFDYVMTMDPGYTYHGVFSVTSYSHEAFQNGILGDIQVHIDANPYKLKNTQTYRLNAPGGRMYYLPSGRMPVRPVIETYQPTKVIWNGKVIQLGIGTFRLNDVLFKEGVNELYLNTFEIYDTLWEDVGEGGINQMTWDEARQYRWDELQRLNIDGTNVRAYSWDDITNTGQSWNDLKEAGVRWRDLDYYSETGDGKDGKYLVIVQYEWGDL